MIRMKRVAHVRDGGGNQSEQRRERWKERRGSIKERVIVWSLDERLEVVTNEVDELDDGRPFRVQSGETPASCQSCRFVWRDRLGMTCWEFENPDGR
jgi:hypothetical protein